jgi:hypothetical protein
MITRHRLEKSYDFHVTFPSSPGPHRLEDYCMSATGQQATGEGLGGLGLVLRPTPEKLLLAADHITPRRYSTGEGSKRLSHCKLISAHTDYSQATGFISRHPKMIWILL